MNLFEPEPSEKSRQKVYSVSELNREIRACLEPHFTMIWVEAEISNLKLHTSGHIYLTLKDEKSQMSAVFFSRYNQGMKFRLKDGLKVLAFGKISVYEPRGSYQLYIEKIQPKGMGELQLAFMQLKEKLQKEGLFETERKKLIPPFPKTIGVVTSPTGAAIQDILNIVNRRFQGVHLILNPVKVQGDGAAEEIARAIHEFQAIEGVDVLIVGRGGGSLEDLWAFNEEIVARAIFNSKIPVISAVGHEIDWTIADFVADLRAPTPSAAAELVTQNQADLLRQLKTDAGRIQMAMRSALEQVQEKLETLSSSYAFRQPRSLLDQLIEKVDDHSRQMQNHLKNFYQHSTQRMKEQAGRLHALSPLAVLDRGYSIAFDAKGKVLKQPTQVKVGDEIVTRLKKSKIYSRVTQIATD